MSGTGPPRSRDRAGLLTLVVFLVVVALVSVTAPDPSTDARRSFDDVGVGAWGRMDRASVRVDGVGRTRTAVTASDRALDSAVTFVVVDYTASVVSETMRFTEVVLRTRDGQDYEPRSEFELIGSLQPGFTRRGSLVFEVPDDRVPGAVLVVDVDGAAFDVYSRAIRVDLGLTAGGPSTATITVASAVTEVTP